MVLMQNNGFDKQMEDIRAMYEDANERGVTQAQFAMELGISVVILRRIITEPGFKPGKNVRRKIQEYIERGNPKINKGGHFAQSQGSQR